MNLPYTLHHGDCLEKMKLIPDGSVDMVMCDLPYGTTACKWDSVIPFEPLWAAYKRVCKKNAAIVLTASQPFTSALVMSNLADFKYDWCWRKPKGTGHLNAKKMPMRDKEDILVFYRDQCTYNPQFSTGTPFKNKAGDPGKATSMTDSYGAYTNKREDNPGIRYPKQVVEFGVVERGTVHPTQKPVALMEYLIKTYTNEGETVLDNTMGSGTTGVACMNINRRFIGIERDDKYFEIAKGRIEAAHKNYVENLL
jgi:site-specific DNA-methyltransferase (adenine-specific)